MTSSAAQTDRFCPIVQKKVGQVAAEDGFVISTVFATFREVFVNGFNRCIAERAERVFGLRNCEFMHCVC